MTLLISRTLLAELISFISVENAWTHENKHNISINLHVNFVTPLVQICLLNCFYFHKKAISARQWTLKWCFDSWCCFQKNQYDGSPFSVSLSCDSSQAIFKKQTQITKHNRVRYQVFCTSQSEHKNNFHLLTSQYVWYPVGVGGGLSPMFARTCMNTLFSSFVFNLNFEPR